MDRKPIHPSSPGLRTARIFQIFLWLFWAGLAVGCVNLVLGIAGEIPKLKTTGNLSATMLDVYIEVLLKTAVNVWILVHLQILVLSISRGEAFDPRNPLRIRKIGAGVIASALIAVLSDLYWSGLPELTVVGLKNVFSGAAARSFLVGLGLFIVATAFERGLALKRDRDLTI